LHRREPEPVSIADAISRYVTELARIPSRKLASWLPGLQMAAGWQVGHAEKSASQPTRIAVYSHDPNAGWDACETIDVFTFTGSPPDDIVWSNADCGLRALRADDINVWTLVTPYTAQMHAMRSSGYISLTEHQRIWAQYSTYIAYADSPGLLAEQSIYVRTERLSPLSDDIAQLTDALQAAFNQRVRLPRPSMERRDSAR
jgi:hypothetical protein